VTTFLLDTTVQIEHLRQNAAVQAMLVGLSASGHTLATSCVSLAELEHGIRRHERRSADTFLARVRLLPTTWEAAIRAGRYMAELSARGVTLQLPDALIAGTARAHGAVLVTHNLQDFPMRDIRVVAPG
jgi:predicted nucleic acid-binding protein